MLEVVDLHKSMQPADYRRIFPKLQERLRELQYAVHEAEIPVVIALEGWDASGRGELIKVLNEVLDPRMFRVYPGTVPSPLEKRHHFLWRYQTALPNDGEMALFDHSWYGRVLVDRVDKVVHWSEWQPAYEQINQFERWLADDNEVLVKFWLHISRKEQKKRFDAFEKDPNRAWKITKEYKRHHRQYEKWVAAVEEMLAKTDSPYAPWTIVESTDLRWARVKVFQVLIKRIEEVVARRVAQPAAVSRTAAARKATAKERQSRQAANTAIAHEKAREEGMPIEEPQPEAAKKPRRKAAAGK